MGGHTFIVPAFQESAFVLTTIGLRQGFAWKTIPNLPVGNAGTVNVSTSGIAQTLDGGVHLTDWLGLTGGVGAYALTGSSAKSLVSFGGEYLYGAQLGLAGRIARFEKTHTFLGAHVGAAVATGRLLSIRSLAAAIARDSPGNLNGVVNGDLASTVLTPITTTSLGGSLNFAQTITRAVGVQAQLGVAFLGASTQPYDFATRSTASASTSSIVPGGAIAVGVDGASQHLPLTAMLEYAIQFPRTKDETGGTSSHTQHVFALGAYYTARKDLQIGLVASEKLNLEPVSGVTPGGGYAASDRPSVFAIEAVARYVW
jgi:hypothetical protein